MPARFAMVHTPNTPRHEAQSTKHKPQSTKHKAQKQPASVAGKWCDVQRADGNKGELRASPPESNDEKLQRNQKALMIQKQSTRCRKAKQSALKANNGRQATDRAPLPVVPSSTAAPTPSSLPLVHAPLIVLPVAVPPRPDPLRRPAAGRAAVEVVLRVGALVRTVPVEMGGVGRDGVVG